MTTTSRSKEEVAMASRPANLLVASNHEDCARLKDLVSKEDATTMVVVMTTAKSAKEEGGSSSKLRMDPRLLLAARSGDCVELEDLLKNLQQQTPPAAESSHVIVHVPEQEDGTKLLPDDSGDAAAQIAAGGVVQEEGVADDHPPLADNGDEHAAAESLLSGVSFDFDGDSALHVAAAGGDSEEYLKCAEIIYNSAKDLLDATNKNGDTPLHCAARAGNSRMVSRLMELAASENDAGRGASRKKELLRRENKIGETALHEAIRNGSTEIITRLISEDPELAAVPRAAAGGGGGGGGGASALYLAVSSRRWDVVDELFSKCPGLSYAGPDGQNVLHIGVFREQDLQRLLERCRGRSCPIMDLTQQDLQCLLELCRSKRWPIMDLTQQGDKHGSTPLHLASSEEDWSELKSLDFWLTNYIMDHLGYPLWFLGHMTSREGPTKWLIEANKSALCQPDKKGSYPIHVAAYSGRLKPIVVMLESFPGCATLRDSRGRTFLHIAVEKKIAGVVAFASKDPKLARVLNMQDKDGNTALHLAVEAGDKLIFNLLFQNRRVRLDLSNKDGLTAITLAWFKIPGRGRFYNRQNPRYFILRALAIAQAPGSDRRMDHLQEKDTREINEDEASEKITNATQVLGVVSVLVATVTFAAVFTLPGGYRSDGGPNLAGSYLFNAFVVAVALGFICSLLATSGLIYAGFPSYDYSIRGRYFDTSHIMMQSSVRSLAVAFALAVYLEMAPVAHKTAIAVCAIVGVGLLLQNFEIRQAIMMANTIRIRLGLRAARIRPIFGIAGVKFWSLVIIFALPALWRIHQNK